MSNEAIRGDLGHHLDFDGRFDLVASMSALEKMRHLPFPEMILLGSAFALCAHRFFVNQSEHLRPATTYSAILFCLHRSEDNSLRRMKKLRSCTWMTEPEGTYCPLLYGR